MSAPVSQMGVGSARVLRLVASALGAVILAPIALSSQDLVAWAASLVGLNLPGGWPWVVPLALDFAAGACIGMTVVAAWRRDRAGVFGLLVWVFAGVSAYAQYRHGMAERAAGRAQDAWWAMPAFALLGPGLLEATLTRLRRWARQDTDELLTGAAGFGSRWLVAPWSTLSAWAVSRREGIASAQAALRFVTDRQVLRQLSPVEAVQYAFAALGDTDAHTARVWLARRRVHVSQTAVDDALATQPGTPLGAAVSAAGRGDEVDDPGAGPVESGRARPAGEKRQPSARELILRAHTRTPAASDAQIAARLELSEATVRRHRRQPVDSVSTGPTQNSGPTTAATTPANGSSDGPVKPRSRRQAVDTLSTANHNNPQLNGLDHDGEYAPV